MVLRTDRLSPSAASSSSDDLSFSPVTRLSDLHKECLRLVAQGLQSKEIAQKVGRSHRTVDTYISAALPLFDTSDRRVAARRFLALEAVEPAPPNPSDESANTRTDLSQRLLSQPETVADIGIFTDDSRRATGLVQSFRRLIHLPPLGGKPNDLTAAGTFFNGTQIGLIGSMTLMAIVAIVQGIISLLT
jgi:DNA-binding CsgD family transcriptional regulator